jgi:CheY-like chemotaxis protein
VTDEDKERAKQAGFDLHLAKPIELPELQELLRRVEAGSLGNGHARSEVPS